MIKLNKLLKKKENDFYEKLIFFLTKKKHSSFRSSIKEKKFKKIFNIINYFIQIKIIQKINNL